MKIGIIGTRGIPNYYGGFEKFAQILSTELVKLGAEVWVYNSHNHPYREPLWQNVNIIHKFDPENKIGTAGQFIYDLNCILNSRKYNFDIILQLGYTSSSVWHKLMPRKSIIVTNMDGLEWKRSKYPLIVRRFLKYAEKLAAKNSTYLIADSPAIQQYLDEEYNAESNFISYGAELFDVPDESVLSNFKLSPGNYFLIIARMQKDNNIEEIIKGVVDSKTDYPLVIIGNINKYAKKLVKKYKYSRKIIFLGAIYDENILNQLRYFSVCYFHGHSAGGTNPSLLEAMAASAFICAHNNPFNKAVLNDNALYFETYKDISGIISKQVYNAQREAFIQKNLRIIETKHNWEKIAKSYHQVFLSLINLKQNN